MKERENVRPAGIQYRGCLPVSADTYGPGADTEEIPVVKGEASGPGADTKILPAVTDETPWPSRRRWSRQVPVKANLTLTAEITERYSKLTGEITKAPEGSYRVQYRH